MPDDTPRQPAPNLAPTLAPTLTDVNALRAIMARLRDPANGCPRTWRSPSPPSPPTPSRKPSSAADAIARGDLAALKDELGDLLFQVVFHARIAEEAGQFGFDDVVTAICDKMVRRHPHVFGDARVATMPLADAWLRDRSKRRSGPRPPRRAKHRPASWTISRRAYPP